MYATVAKCMTASMAFWEKNSFTCQWIAINWAEEIMLATPQQVQCCHMTNYPVHLKFHKFKGFSTNFASDYHGFTTH
jgi:alpha-L-arabinofuranosidase